MAARLVDGLTVTARKEPLTQSPLLPIFPLPGEREDGEGSWSEGALRVSHYASRQNSYS